MHDDIEEIRLEILEAEELLKSMQKNRFTFTDDQGEVKRVKHVVHVDKRQSSKSAWAKSGTPRQRPNISSSEESALNVLKAEKVIKVRQPSFSLGRKQIIKADQISTIGFYDIRDDTLSSKKRIRGIKLNQSCSRHIFGKTDEGSIEESKVVAVSDVQQHLVITESNERIPECGSNDLESLPTDKKQKNNENAIESKLKYLEPSPRAYSFGKSVKSSIIEEIARIDADRPTDILRVEIADKWVKPKSASFKMFKSAEPPCIVNGVVSKSVGARQNRFTVKYRESAKLLKLNTGEISADLQSLASAPKNEILDSVLSTVVKNIISAIVASVEYEHKQLKTSDPTKFIPDLNTNQLAKAFYPFEGKFISHLYFNRCRN